MKESSEFKPEFGLYVAIAKPQIEGMHDSILDAFERMDIDRNGHIDQSEFAQLATGLGTVLSPAEIERTFQELDINANGLIDFGEFAQWWTRTSK